MKISGEPNRSRMPLVASANARGASSRANASSCSAMTARMAVASSAVTSAAGDAATKPKRQSASVSDRNMSKYRTLRAPHERRAAAPGYFTRPRLRGSHQ